MPLQPSHRTLPTLGSPQTRRGAAGTGGPGLSIFALQRPARVLTARLSAAGWLLLCTVLLWGCGGTVELRQPFPTPLVEKLPLGSAIIYPPELANYIHEDQDANGAKWIIPLGEPSTRMFDIVFSALFDEVHKAPDMAAAQALQAPPMLVLKPAIATFELSTPGLSGTPYFGTWIRYELDLLDGQGSLLLRWPVTGYGQAGTAGMSDEHSVRLATLLALRDAAATIAVELPDQPPIRALLDGEQHHDEH